MWFEDFNFENEKKDPSSNKEDALFFEREFIKKADEMKNKIQSLELENPHILSNYILLGQTFFHYLQELKDPNNYGDNWELDIDLKKELDELVDTKKRKDFIKPALTMPNDFDWNFRDWCRMPEELKEHIINWWTEVFLEPWDLISWGLISVYVWLEKIIWKGFLLVIKESWKAFLKWASEEIIPIDLIMDWKEILELLKNKWISLIESWKEFIEDTFLNPSLITPEWIKINEKSFDNFEDSFKMSKGKVSFEEAIENYVIPKDIENMSVKEFWRTLQEWIHQNLIQAPIWKMTEERREKFFEKHIEAMEWILKWVEKHPEEAKTRFKDKLKDYFLDVKRESRDYDLQQWIQDSILNWVKKLDVLIIIY